MYAGWMTIVGMVLASALWLAWEGYQHDARSPAGCARERAMLVIGAVLALASAGLGAMGYAMLVDPASAGLLLPGVAFAAALALAVAAVMLFQTVGHLRRARDARC